jgi:hypothetical protein
MLKFLKSDYKRARVVSTEVEQLPHDLKFEGLNPAFAGSRREETVKKL